MKPLMERYSKRLAEGGWIDCWFREEIERELGILADDFYGDDDDEDDFNDDDDEEE